MKSHYNVRSDHGHPRSKVVRVLKRTEGSSSVQLGSQIGLGGGRSIWVMSRGGVSSQWVGGKGMKSSTSKEKSGAKVRRQESEGPGPRAARGPSRDWQCGVEAWRPERQSEHSPRRCQPFLQVGLGCTGSRSFWWHHQMCVLDISASTVSGKKETFWVYLQGTAFKT